MKDPLNAFHVRKAVPPWQEVHRAPIVWPANLKKRRSPAKRNVPLVHRAITRTRQTWTRASNAHLGMPNRPPGKRRAFPASKENTTMSKVRRRASLAKKTPIPRTKTEPPNALIVQRVGRPMTAVQNVSLAVRVHSALSVKIVHWVLPDKGTTMILPNADNVT